MADAGGSQAGAIEVTTGYMVLAFLLAAFKTRVAIDGQTYELPWGTNTFPVEPGRHRVRISFKYLIPSDAGANQVDVDVSPGETVRVGYRAPWLVFLAGKITVGGAPARGAAPSAGAAAASASAAGAGAAPDWYPDPARRHELRYWDGQTWTPNVSDRGVAGTDPV
ncbi:MAG: hypothetical protein QOD63_2943 [Actinomycetota bacterium]|nr:hypothetical protein [Actinomycetota bacterium]